MIVEVTRENLLSAAEIHAESWRDSHRAFCGEAFVSQHTTARQKIYLEQEMEGGKQLYMLIRDAPVGIVSVKDSLIENLYVLPSEQHKGYGAELLLFAVKKCKAAPCLWVLNNNEKALSLYLKFGFRVTGRRHTLSEQLFELELSMQREQGAERPAVP